MTQFTVEYMPERDGIMIKASENFAQNSKTFNTAFLMPESPQALCEFLQASLNSLSARLSKGF